MALHDALNRVADAVAEQLPAKRLVLRLGRVTSIDSGAAADGSDVVTVAVGADEIAAPRLASYSSPDVDDLVAVLLADASPLILGRVTGAPDIT